MRWRTGLGWRCGPWALGAVSLAIAAHLLPSPARSDGLIDEVPNTSSDTLVTLFPNWSKAPVAFFDLTICPDASCPCPVGNFQSLTLFNYGNATGGGTGDITATYFNLLCGKNTYWGTLTYAGAWTIGAATYAAWTWVGPYVWPSDPNSGCGGTVQLSTYADIHACPTDGRSVVMGLGFNNSVPGPPGGVWDTCGYQVPSYPEALKQGTTKFIRYVTKTADKVYAAPGDTVTYTLTWGRPGTGAISNFIVTDSIPPYTHFVTGSASAAPDPGYDPNLGPPIMLRWTLAGAASTAGGPTQQLSFKITVDWGNGEAFESGSGDFGAPEGSRLGNVGAVEALGSGCAAARMSPPADTVVRRFMMWKIADQDALFAPRIGLPDDEITYSIFLTNMSTGKTWWNVDIWDTVPAQLETWPSGFGFWDNCAAAWTMTPTGGCSPGSPGWRVGGGATVMTWRIADLAPGATVQLDWKARVKPAGAAAGSTAQGYVLVQAAGQSGIIGGTGNSMQPRRFFHAALIVLRTTYFSYVGQAADSSSCAGDAINFFPLNKAANFELRKLYYEGAGFATTGGKSASITAFQGTCLGGFVDGGYGGCGIERAPAQYFWLASCNAAPNAALYKLTANVPVLWILMPDVGGGGDAFTFIPSTTLSFSGWTHYSYRRSVSGSTVQGWGESWVVFNTGIDPAGGYSSTMATTVHVFRWQPALLQYTYLKSADIAGESLWMPFAGCPLGDDGQYKIISSDTKLTVYQGYGTIGDPNITFAYNDHGGNAPDTYGGTYVGKPGQPATFYAIANHDPDAVNFLVGNNSNTKATFRIYRYQPNDVTLAVQGIPVTLCGAAGRWVLLGSRFIDGGFTSVATADPNAFVGGTAGGQDTITTGVGSTANAWKVEWVAGGNLSVYSGTHPYYNWAGGNMMHATDGNTTGQEFWLHVTNGQSPSPWAFVVFCPVAGMVVNATSSDALTSTYTTDGPDQAIMFTDLPAPGWGGRRNWRFQVMAAGAQGEAMTQRHQPQYREKFYTAPFVATGVHYDVFMPPVVFTGQPFWITVVVVMGTGTTQVDYCGTSSFTSTDPGGKIEGTAMDAYNFTWSSSAKCSAVPDENGVRIFYSVTFNVLGDQTLIVTDTLDGSITGLGSTVVVGVDVKIEKLPRFQVAASGDTVQFRICWSNFSSSSAFTFVMTDAVPMGTTYLPEAGTWALSCGNTDGIGPGVAYSTATTPTVPPAGSFVTANPVTGTRWLRWTVPYTGVQTTGCTCFRVQVN